jgi:peptidyl-tRNA hydrolase, PTH1 family
VGVGRGDTRRELADHVLARVSGEDRELLAHAVARAADATELFIAEGIDAAMNAYNRDAEAS